MGRTPLGWIKIWVFYNVFYFCLACFFLLHMVIFLRTIDDTIPKYTMYTGPIGSNPGIAFRPRDDLYLSTLIWFRAGNDESFANWGSYKHNLLDHLSPYYELEEKRRSYSNHIQQCDYDSRRLSLDGPICSQNLDSLMQGNCHEQNDFGYASGKPCVLVKLNKIIGWYPEPLDHDEDSWYPDVIRDAMLASEDPHNDRVWIECHGKHAADKENLGPLNYYPGMGMPTAWFPYLNQEDYLSPLMFIELANPARGVLISVECTAWARNIVQDKERQRGVGYFQIMID